MGLFFLKQVVCKKEPRGIDGGHNLLTVCMQCSPPHDAWQTILPFSVLARGRESATWQKDSSVMIQSFSPIKNAAFLQPI